MSEFNHMGARSPGMLKRLSVVTATCLGLTLLSVALTPDTGHAYPVRGPDGLRVFDSGDVVNYRGEQVCWYRHAWNGPGWYRCGSDERGGFGWVGDPYRFGLHHSPYWYGRPPRHHPHHGPRPPVSHPGKPPSEPPGQGGPAKPPR